MVEKDRAKLARDPVSPSPNPNQLNDGPHGLTSVPPSWRTLGPPHHGVQGQACM